MSFSNAIEVELLDHILGDGSFDSPSETWVGLFTTACTDASAGTECSGTGYVRKQIAAGEWDPAASGSPSTKKNSAVITFATAGSGGWGTVTHFAIFDDVSDSTGSNYLMYGSLTDSKTITEGDTASFAIDAITVSLD